MTVHFIVPCFNAAPNLNALLESVLAQADHDWKLTIIDDMSDDDTTRVIDELWLKHASIDQTLRAISNSEKKYALRNIVETVQKCEPDDIIAVIDGDDELCNPKTVGLLHDAYADGCDVVWTAHRWDINGQNISKELPEGVNPYQYPWCSSHLRTFRANLLQQTPVSNFKDFKDEWFQRGYDQALMLPLLHQSKKHRYIDEVCYLYKINSVSVNDRDWAERKQLSTVNFVRARGFLSV